METNNVETEKKNIGPMKWEGAEGDGERLEKKFGIGECGVLSWREIGLGLKEIFPNEKTEEMIDSVRAIHGIVRDLYLSLDYEKKPFYHNIGSWEEADGHSDWVMILTAREIVGAIKAKKLSIPISDISLILKAMILHDVDWMREGGEEEAEKTIRELLVNNEKDEDINKIIDVTRCLKYGEGRTDSILKDFGWDIDTQKTVFDIVRRNDFLQVVDKNYPSGDLLFADMMRFAPEYLESWNWKSPIDAMPDERFYKMAESKVFAEDMEDIGYHKFFSIEEEGLLKKGWERFRKIVFRE